MKSTEQTRHTKDCGVTARRHLVVVGAAVSGRHLFRGAWTVGVHPSTSSSLPHVAVVIVQAHKSFIHIHFLVQINSWTGGIVALRTQKATVNVHRMPGEPEMFDSGSLNTTTTLEKADKTILAHQ